MVASYQCPDKDFPAFYSKRSGCKAPYNLANAYEAAQLILSSKQLKMNSGILIGVPVPDEYAMDGKFQIMNFVKPKFNI